jgi:dihydrofolate reductase
VTQFLALRELFGLLADVLMMMQGGREYLTEPLTLGLTQRCRVLKARVSLLGQGREVFPDLKELVCRLANQRDEDTTLAPTAAAKATHNFREALPQDFPLILANRATTAQVGDAGDDL